MPSRPVQWNGTEYPSARAAAKALGITAEAMRQRLLKGYTCDADLNTRSTKIRWNGIEYPSAPEAARALGVTTQTVMNRHRKNQTCEADLYQSEPLKVRWNGVEYASANEAARVLGVSLGTVLHRHNIGHTCDADLKNGDGRKRRAIRIFWEGVEYASATEAAKATGVSINTVTRRHYAGLTSKSEMWLSRRDKRRKR